MNQLGKNWSWMQGHVNWLAEYANEIKMLPYYREQFNDETQFQTWKTNGFNPRTGFLFDMKNKNQPSLTKRLIEYANNQGLENVGVSYYQMCTGDNLPYHSDRYIKYINLFNLENRKKDIIRYIFFPENRLDGHIFEVDGKLIDWKAGDWVAWRYDTPHMAANFGYENRYTIQVTGVISEDL